MTPPPGITFISHDAAVNLVAAQLAQLDQAITILGPASILGANLAKTREVWAAAQGTLSRHEPASDCGDGVECLHTQVIYSRPRSPWLEVAADELMVGLVGVQRRSQLLGLLISIVDPPKEKP